MGEDVRGELRRAGRGVLMLAPEAAVHRVVEGEQDLEPAHANARMLEGEPRLRSVQLGIFGHPLRVLPYLRERRADDVF